MDEQREKLIADSFFIKDKRERALYELNSKKKRREFIFKLSEKIILAERAHKIKDSIVSFENIENVLLDRQAPNECYVLSIDEDIDGKIMTLHEALSRVVGFGPALISCIDGRLAYLECEQSQGAPERFILIA